MVSSVATSAGVPGSSVPLRNPGLVERLFERILLWLTLARSRRDLAALDERALHDIGIDRATAMEEAAKPFWRSP